MNMRCVMKYLKIIGSNLKNACVYFAVTQLFITAIFQLTAGEGSKGQFLMFDIELLLLGFSIVMAVIQNVFKIKKLSLAVKLLIHFLLTMAALFGLFITVTGQITNVRSVVFLMSAAAVVYAVFAAVVIIVRAVKRKREEQNKEYTPVFEKKNKKE